MAGLAHAPTLRPPRLGPPRGRVRRARLGGGRGRRPRRERRVHDQGPAHHRVQRPRRVPPAPRRLLDAQRPGHRALPLRRGRRHRRDRRPRRPVRRRHPARRRGHRHRPRQQDLRRRHRGQRRRDLAARVDLRAARADGTQGPDGEGDAVRRHVHGRFPRRGVDAGPPEDRPGLHHRQARGRRAPVRGPGEAVVLRHQRLPAHRPGGPLGDGRRVLPGR